jgi:hypothetical protein
VATAESRERALLAASSATGAARKGGASTGGQKPAGED